MDHLPPTASQGFGHPAGYKARRSEGLSASLAASQLAALSCHEAANAVSCVGGATGCCSASPLSGISRRRQGSQPHGDGHGVLRRLLLQLLLQPQLLLARCEGPDRLRDQSELDIQGGDQDHGREDHRQPRRLPARHPGGRWPRVRHRRRDRVLLPGRRAGQPLAALRRAGRNHRGRPHLVLDPGPRRVPLQPQLPLLPPGQEGGPVRRRGGGGRAEHVALLLPTLAVAAHPVLHATSVVPAHTLLHTAAAGVPLSIPADTVLHATVTATTGFSFSFAALAVDATGAATSTIIPFPSSATDFLGTISAAAPATACIPIPFAAVSTATSLSAFSASTVVVFTTASSAPATTSAAFLSLAFPAITIFPSNCKPFGPISSTFKALPERSKHLVLFQNPTINKVIIIIVISRVHNSNLFCSC